jgi:EAL domain-containing protein (putative c-di-GMP-specific phosphodiesterase class I)/GGDEF domain-containing protein
MNPAGESVLGLVELSDINGLLDTYGPESFKLLHEAFIDRLKSWARSNDNLRKLGNDRMCVILKNVRSRAQIELAAAKLCRIFEEPYCLLGTPVLMEVTAGFVILEAKTTDIKLAIRQAGKALRQARKSSQLFNVYGPQCEENYIDERKMVRQLEAAVELGELELYYQPKMHAGYRSLVGAEALMRWPRENRQVVTPDQFIPIAERHQVIKPMTWWAIKSAVSRLARWPEELSLAVNITPTLLMDDEILMVVKDSLEIHGVKARRLVLEVTESIMVDNQDIMMSKLASLRSLGVKIAIDDFGTGFSSLTYFRDLPADEIKIDKGFVIPMLRSKKDHAIVKAVIDLAHNFSLRVVAEGVEDEHIADRLTEMRCDVLQGYAFDPALPIDDFEKRYLG